MRCLVGNRVYAALNFVYILFEKYYLDLNTNNSVLYEPLVVG